MIGAVMKDKYNMTDITIIKLLSFIQFIILGICLYLLEWPIFNQQNILVFLVAAFSFYLYIITVKSLKL